MGQSPALIAKDVAIRSSTTQLGEYIELDFRIQNEGILAAGSSKGEVYLATFTTQPNLIRLGEIAVPALASFAETDRSQFNFSTPSHITAGSKTLIIRVDSKKQSSEWIASNDFSSISYQVEMDRCYFSHLAHPSNRPT